MTIRPLLSTVKCVGISPRESTLFRKRQLASVPVNRVRAYCVPFYEIASLPIDEIQMTLVRTKREQRWIRSLGNGTDRSQLSSRRLKAVGVNALRKVRRIGAEVDEIVAGAGAQGW